MRFVVNSTKLLLLASAVSLAACGSGGDGDAGSLTGLPSEGGSNGGGTGNGSGGGTPSAQLAIGSGSGDDFQSGALTLSSPTISSGGQLTVTASVVDQAASNALYTSQPTSVAFTSNCVAQGTATITSPVSTGQVGTAQAVYKANGCTGSDTVTASISNGASTASANIIVASADAGSLSFSSATPSTIAIKNLGSAGLTTVAEVQFVVKDDTGNPIRGEVVNFTISDETGGVSLSNDSATTDANGIARAFVNSGTVKTTVRVTAVLASDPTLQNMSTPIAIGTGVPTAETLSFSTKAWNMPACYDADYENEVTIKVSDFYRNPVPEGTKIIFFTSHGQIDSECSYDPEKGGCSATWRRVNPLPWDNQGNLSVMATLKGEEAAGTDDNGNGLFDISEGYTATPEAFLDENTNGAFDIGERFIDWDGNSEYSLTPAVNKYGTSQFRGVRCTTAARDAGHCQGQADIFIQRTLHISCPVSSSTISFTDANCETPIATESTTGTDSKLMHICLQDATGGAPAAGTSYEVTVSSGTAKIVGDTLTGEVEPNAVGPYVIPLEIEPGAATTQSKLTIKVTNVEGSSAPVSKSLTINHN